MQIDESDNEHSASSNSEIYATDSPVDKAPPRCFEGNLTKQLFNELEISARKQHYKLPLASEVLAKPEISNLPDTIPNFGFFINRGASKQKIVWICNFIV